MDQKTLLKTRMHSSRMRTVRFSDRLSCMHALPPYPLPHMPPCNACPPCHAHLIATHAPCHAYPSAIHAPLPCMPPPRLLPCMPPLFAMHAPPPLCHACPFFAMHATHPFLWTEGMTHAYENITLPQISFAGGNEIHDGNWIKYSKKNYEAPNTSIHSTFSIFISKLLILGNK